MSRVTSTEIIIAVDAKAETILSGIISLSDFQANPRTIALWALWFFFFK